jgi:hypothetical protein
MNPYQIYQNNSIFTMPLNAQLAEIHKRGALLVKQVKDYAIAGDTVQARAKIFDLEEMITFLRSSLDPSLEASVKADEAYLFYYKIVANWFLDPAKIPPEYDSMVYFWESWSQTWAKVNIK